VLMPVPVRSTVTFCGGPRTRPSRPRRSGRKPLAEGLPDLRMGTGADKPTVRVDDLMFYASAGLHHLRCQRAAWSESPIFSDAVLTTYDVHGLLVPAEKGLGEETLIPCSCSTLARAGHARARGNRLAGEHRNDVGAPRAAHRPGRASDRTTGRGPARTASPVGCSVARFVKFGGAWYISCWPRPRSRPPAAESVPGGSTHTVPEEL
jgi:hypothetical protein